MFKLFIKRPILSGVISVIIVCLGVLSILTLPITQFPDIVPPSVTVTARYTGASADVMSKTVATPLERAINGVPGMTYMTTVCTNDGMSLTTIYFKVGTDPDVAAVNVRRSFFRSQHNFVCYPKAVHTERCHANVPFRTQGFSVGRVFKLRLTVSRGVKQSAYAFEQIVRHITGGGHALVRICLLYTSKSTASSRKPSNPARARP